MAGEYSRWNEHISLSGGYLYGAITGLALAVASLIPLALLLYYLIFLFMYYPAPVSVWAAARGAGTAQNNYLLHWRVPASAVAGHCLFLGGLAFGLPFLVAALHDAVSPGDLPIWISLTYSGVMCHLSILCGGIAASEVIYRRPRVKGTPCGYPTWGYVTGGLLGTVYSQAVSLVAVANGIMGFVFAVVSTFLVIGLAVELYARIAAGFGRILTPPSLHPVRGTKPARAHNNPPVLIILLVTAILAVLFAGIRAR